MGIKEVENLTIRNRRLREKFYDHVMNTDKPFRKFLNKPKNKLMLDRFKELIDETKQRDGFTGQHTMFLTQLESAAEADASDVEVTQSTPTMMPTIELETGEERKLRTYRNIATKLANQVRHNEHDQKTIDNLKKLNEAYGLDKLLPGGAGESMELLHHLGLLERGAGIIEKLEPDQGESTAHLELGANITEHLEEPSLARDTSHLIGHERIVMPEETEEPTLFESLLQGPSELTRESLEQGLADKKIEEFENLGTRILNAGRKGNPLRASLVREFEKISGAYDFDGTDIDEDLDEVFGYVEAHNVARMKVLRGKRHIAESIRVATESAVEKERNEHAELLKKRLAAQKMHNLLPSFSVIQPSAEVKQFVKEHKIHPDYEKLIENYRSVGVPEPVLSKMQGLAFDLSARIVKSKSKSDFTKLRDIAEGLIETHLDEQSVVDTRRDYLQAIDYLRFGEPILMGDDAPGEFKAVLRAEAVPNKLHDERDQLAGYVGMLDELLEEYKKNTKPVKDEIKKLEKVRTVSNSTFELRNLSLDAGRPKTRKAEIAEHKLLTMSVIAVAKLGIEKDPDKQSDLVDKMGEIDSKLYSLWDNPNNFEKIPAEDRALVMPKRFKSREDARVKLERLDEELALKRKEIAAFEESEARITEDLSSNEELHPDNARRRIDEINELVEHGDPLDWYSPLGEEDSYREDTIAHLTGRIKEFNGQLGHINVIRDQFKADLDKQFGVKL